MTEEQHNKDLEVTRFAFLTYIRSVESADQEIEAEQVYARVKKLLDEDWIKLQNNYGKREWPD